MKTKKPKILVGKGLTFDSGGIQSNLQLKWMK
ncbi:MAG: hypothetical protein Ct9H90mP7_1940 [Candidatus Neomarinimicrobiota bacterium]|nr:MAG: hypothetical protein Ct9H90mP7_1940 [Candidatus Neomarinimicrobiota bacterium]